MLVLASSCHVPYMSVTITHPLSSALDFSITQHYAPLSRDSFGITHVALRTRARPLSLAMCSISCSEAFMLAAAPLSAPLHTQTLSIVSSCLRKFSLGFSSRIDFPHHASLRNLPPRQFIRTPSKKIYTVQNLYHASIIMCLWGAANCGQGFT